MRSGQRHSGQDVCSLHAEESEGPWGLPRGTGNLECQPLSLQIGAGISGAGKAEGILGRERKEGEERDKSLCLPLQWSLKGGLMGKRPVYLVFHALCIHM